MIISKESKHLKTILIEDHPMYRAGLAYILEKHPRIQIKHEVGSAEEGLEILKAEDLDFLITDLCLPGMSGTILIEKVREIHPNLPILVLSMKIGKELIKNLLSLNINGYLSKRNGKQELYEAIDSIGNGKHYYSPEITNQILETIDLELQLKSSPILTVREQEVLKLICKQYSNKEIADRLCIAVSTVETHRRSMFQKTNSKCVVGLIKYAVINDLVMW